MPDVSEAPSTSSAQAPSTSSGQVLYRKWRPQTFAEVVGQEAVTRTLRNAVAASKVAHAYLLCGPRGTGKTSLGRLIAKAVNCGGPLQGEPCNQCPYCRDALEGRAIDLVEMDAASNRGIDEIRKLRDRVGLAPMAGRYKVYLIDEVHMLTPEAYNALLKTLEEPPPHIVFVLATTEPHRVPATIISRCQRFDLRRIPLPAVVQRLSQICEGEALSLDEASLMEVARAAGGSLRDAINILEQLAAYYGPEPNLVQVQEALGFNIDARSDELARLILSLDLAAALKVIAAVRDDGIDIRQFSRQLVMYLRALLLLKSGAAEMVDVSQEQLDKMRRVAEEAETSEIGRALKIFGHLDFRDDPLSSLPLELALVDYVMTASQTRVHDGPTTLAAPAPQASEVVSTAKDSGSSGGPPTENSSITETEKAPEITAEGSLSEQPSDLLERIRQACKEIDKRVAAYLNNSCQVMALEGDTIVLGFYFAFHQGKIDAEANRRIVEEAASQVLGRPAHIQCVLTHMPREAKVPSGHLARAARELGARPLSGEGGANAG